MALRSYSALNILPPTIIIIIQECSQALEIYVNAHKVYLVEVCLTCCSSSQLPLICNNIYGVVCVQLAHFSLGDWEDISIAHVIIIIQSEVPTLPIIIFFRGCVPEMLVTYIIFCHLLHIHSGKTRILFSLSLCSSWWVQIVGYILACRSCSFVCTLHHLIIIIVQTYLKTLNL